MEIITKNGSELLLTNIPDGELEIVKSNNEEIITDIYLSKEEKEKIYNGCILNLDMTITETPEYLENKFSEHKRQKAEAIEKIATITDQLNLTAGTLDIVVDLLAKTNPEILENKWIIESKSKLNKIKNILNK